MTERLWKLLLKIKNEIHRRKNDEYDFLWTDMEDVYFEDIPTTLPQDGFALLFHPKKIHSLGTFPLLSVSNNGFTSFVSGRMKDSILRKLQLYLPLCVASKLKQEEQKPLIISHFAQSLDGHIAAPNGHSQWIGNDENLIHAHRLRALCDGVIIGNNTLKNDKPRLSVRLVEGSNPTRIVIGDHLYCTSSLLSSQGKNFRIVSCPTKISEQEGIEFITVPRKENTIPTDDILSELYKKGIRSVLIEGGSNTTSRFIREKNIDMVQLHIAPLLLGKGIPNYIGNEAITKIDDGLHFEQFLFHPVGDAMMFTGYL